MKNGFTLMEVLVAVVLVGLTVTAFFELMAGSLRLEYKVQQKVGLPAIAKQAFDRLMERDVTDEEFPWEGVAAGHPYKLELVPVELQPDEEETRDQEIIITLPQELFAYVFYLYENEGMTNYLRLVKYVSYPPGHFTDEFLESHLSLPDISAEGKP